MGINIAFFATPPGDLRAWALDRLPPWWAAWAGAHPSITIPPPTSDAWHRVEPFDRLAEIVDRVRPESPPGPGGTFFESDRPTRAVFGRALRLLRSGEAAWEARRPREAAVMDDLVRHLLRDTDYHQRYPLTGDPVAAALAPLGPAHALGGDLHMRRHQVPRPERLPARASPALRRLWAIFFAGRTVAVVKPEHAGAWGGASVDDCGPDHNDDVFGWWSFDECGVLLSELEAIAGEPLVPQPITASERRWLVDLRKRFGEAMWAQASANLEARASEFTPYDDAMGLHVVREVATDARAMGAGLGFFLC